MDNAEAAGVNMNISETAEGSMNITETSEINMDSSSMDLSMGDTHSASPPASGTETTKIATSPAHGTLFIEATSSPVPAAIAEGEKSVTSSPAPVKIPAKKRGKSKVDGEEEESPKKRAKVAPKDRQRKAPVRTPAASRPIPRNYEEAEECDRMLVSKRDKNVGWAEVKAEWEKLTGEKIGVSTLPNRYNRLKINFAVVKEEDLPRLLEAKKTVEAAFEVGKWDMIASTVEKLGGDDYKADVLQRQYVKMMKAAGAIPPAGVIDSNFVSRLDGDE